MSSTQPPTPAPTPLRLGPFELKALLGKSERSMLWQVVDSRTQQDLLLALPRAKPADPQAWLQDARRAAKIEHPGLAAPVEVGWSDPWPFITYPRALGLTLAERLVRRKVPSPVEASRWAERALNALGVVHDAGLSHGDLQPFMLLLAEDGHSHVLGIGLHGSGWPSTPEARQRRQAEALDDVLCLGLLLNRLLSGQAPLECTDTREVLQRLPPLGRDFVRLGWEQAHPIDDALRTIVNRATATQPVQRYLQARAFARALEGWRERVQNPEGGMVAQLLDRLKRFGGLPVTRPEAVRNVQAGGLERRHADDLAALVLQDIGLTLELLRRVNLARRREGGGGQASVLNVARAITLVGLEELAAAAQALRPWPGVLAPERVVNLRLALARAHKAAEVARALAPPGYDGEVLRLTALSQNLGRLFSQYHLPDECEQIERLQIPPEPTEDHPNPAGLSERQAAFAVLGCELDELGAAALRLWGLGDEMQQMCRRPDPDQPIPQAHGDVETLRLTCAMANELVDQLAQRDLRRRRLGLDAVTRRYGRVLGLGQEAVQRALFPESAQAAVQHTLA